MSANDLSARYSRWCELDSRWCEFDPRCGEFRLAVEPGGTRCRSNRSGRSGRSTCRRRIRGPTSPPSYPVRCRVPVPQPRVPGPCRSRLPSAAAGRRSTHGRPRSATPSTSRPAPAGPAPCPPAPAAMSWRWSELRRGGEWTSAAALFAFVCWGIWVISDGVVRSTTPVDRLPGHAGRRGRPLQPCPGRRPSGPAALAAPHAPQRPRFASDHRGLPGRRRHRLPAAGRVGDGRVPLGRRAGQLTGLPPVIPSTSPVV